MDILNNKQKFQFEAHLSDGEIARVEYRWKKGAMCIMHTWVPPSGRGKGVAEQLVKYVLDYVRIHGLRIIPYCSYTIEYIKEHPEYEDLKAPSNH